MRLQRVRVSGLFGSFDHEIRFPERERLVIVHGPNGFGKTVILRMISGLITGATDIFFKTPFREFRLGFDDGSERVVTRLAKTDEGGSPQVTFARTDSQGNVVVEEQGKFSVPEEILNAIDRFVPGWHRSGDGWRDETGAQKSLRDVLSTFPAVRHNVPKRISKHFRDTSVENLKVFFVETERLSGSDRHVSQSDYIYSRDFTFHSSAEPPKVLRVEEYSKDIVKRINSILALYAKHSQESDRTFPERLVRFLRTTEHPLTALEILSEMTVLEEKRQRLISLGFLDKESGLRDLTQDDVNRAIEALTIYVRDVREKFKVFDDMAVRIGMLTDIINDRFRYKQLTIDRERGFLVASNAAGPVALSDLSSGEQHELVLLYELLFKVASSDLVLIDEPEISLHVAWQSRFLQDLIGILELTNAHAVIATHSPVIIGTRWDLTVGLRGPDGIEET